MSVTDRSYTHNFFKVKYIIIQTILSRKSIKKFAVTHEKIFHVYKAFDHKSNCHAHMRAFDAQLLERGFQHGEEGKKLS